MFTLGADPEVFVKKNGKAISVHETGLPGTKKEPFKTEFGAVQQDGLAAEFNIVPTPYTDFEGFNLNITRTLRDLRQLTKANLAIQPIMDFDPEYLAGLPESTLELGCDPDYNAYTLLANPRPDGTRSFRTAAGHVHIGWGADIPVENPEHMEICAGFIKMLDATVGMYMTFIDREPRRRELYGKAGAFRPKPYGVEYRTPSNVWIADRDRRQMMHHMIKMAINRMTQGQTVEKLTKYSEGEIENIINTGDYKTANAVIDRLLGFNAGPGWNKIKRQMEEQPSLNLEEKGNGEV